MWSNCSNAATSMAVMATQLELERKQRSVAADVTSAKAAPKDTRRYTNTKPSSQGQALANYRSHGTQKTASTWKNQMSARKKVFKDVSVAEVEESSSSNSTAFSATNTGGLSSSHFDQTSHSSDGMSLDFANMPSGTQNERIATMSPASCKSQIEQILEEEAECTFSASQHENSVKDMASEDSVCPPESVLQEPTKASTSTSSAVSIPNFSPKMTSTMNGMNKPVVQAQDGRVEFAVNLMSPRKAEDSNKSDTIGPELDCGHSLTNSACEGARSLHQAQACRDEIVPLQGSLSNIPSISFQSKPDDDEMTQLTMDDSYWGEMDATPSTTPIATSSSSVISEAMGSTDSVQLYKKSRSARPRSKQNESRDNTKSSKPTLGAVSVGSSRLAEILSKEIWSSDVEILKSALETIAEIAGHGTSEQKLTILRYGCISSVLRVIETQTSEVIQLLAIRILERLASDPQNGLTIAEMGGLCTISSVLQHQHESINVQRVACRALDLIARYRDDPSTMPNRFELPIDGTVEALATCMAMFPDDVDIQAHAFSAIASLSTRHPRAFDEFVRVDALQAMVVALSKKWKSKSKKSNAISAMANLMCVVSRRGEDDTDNSDFVEFETTLNDGSDCDNSSGFWGPSPHSSESLSWKDFPYLT